MIHKSCCKELYMSVAVLILLLVLSTRYSLQMSIIIHTDRGISHFPKVGICMIKIFQWGQGL